MRFQSLRQVLFVLIILSFALGVRADNNIEHNLTLTIHCPQKDIRQGDEIPIIFTITNNGPTTYSFDTRNSDRSGRMREYKMVATHRHGTIVPNPRQNYREGIGGGLSGETGEIRIGKSFSHTIALNRWALIKAPGKYTVTGIYSYHVRVSNPKNRHISGTVRMKSIQVKSESIEIVVKSRGRLRMGWYIKSLVKKLEAIKPSKNWEIVQQREAIIAQLAYTCDDRIVPTLLDLMYKNHHPNELFWAVEAFVCYLPHNPQIENAILRETAKRGLTPGMQSVLEAFDCSEEVFNQIIALSLDSDNFDIRNAGVGAAQEHPSDKYMSRLISIAMNINTLRPDQRFSEIERSRTIYAIAHNRTDEGVEILKALLKDPDESIRKTTEDAIRQAYRRHPEYPEKEDKEYTAVLVPVALDFDHPMHIPAIMQIYRSRTKEGVSALKTLVKNPEQDVDITKTDAGVRVICDLLRNPNEEIRRATVDIVEGVYREYPGRPLQNDDFPDEFKDNPDEQKKKTLQRFGK